MWSPRQLCLPRSRLELHGVCKHNRIHCSPGLAVLLRRLSCRHCVIQPLLSVSYDCLRAVASAADAIHSHEEPETCCHIAEVCPLALSCKAIVLQHNLAAQPHRVIGLKLGQHYCSPGVSADAKQQMPWEVCLRTAITVQVVNGLKGAAKEMVSDNELRNVGSHQAIVAN